MTSSDNVPPRPLDDLLRRLGQGESLAALAASSGRSIDDLLADWQAECLRRTPASSGARTVAGLRAPLRIVRDRVGAPHVEAADEIDAFFGFGYAVAEDRLFQLDHARRKARGRLAEILGPEALDSDRLYRTLDLPRIASAEWESLPDDVRRFLQAYADGVNAAIAAMNDRLPVEFALLDYRPEPWTPLDSLVVVGDFRWYLTGRFPVIVVPELVKRAVGDGPLYHAFLLGEENDEPILPSGVGAYPTRSTSPSADAPPGSPAPAAGSNNWVVSADRFAGPGPLVASDPHVPFTAVSIWHPVHLQGGSLNAAGIALAGMPGILIGRNERVAWGVTNNICSQRDLYQERADPDRPDHFQYGDAWEPATRRVETIRVRGAADVVWPVLSTRHGPLVDRLLPAPARDSGPVSLRWLGVERCGWVASLIRLQTAGSAPAAREALRGWLVPTFNVVFADVDGRIGYQCTGAIPLRRRIERGYRQGWNPDDAWTGLIPFDEMPTLLDPPSGAIVTANNRVADDDFLHPLSGTWTSGYRARRLRQSIEAAPRLDRDAHRRLQLDVYSRRAARCVPPLLAALAAARFAPSPAEQAALDRLAAWDFQMSADSSGGAVFHLFFTHWCRAVAAERLPAELVELASANAGGLAVELLAADPWNWFAPDRRPSAIGAAFRSAVAELVARLGPDPHDWRWGRLHPIVRPHFLSKRGDLGRLLDRDGLPAAGDAHTINSASPDAAHAAWLGAGFRMLAELGDPGRGLWSVDLGGVSGNPGSPHYDDQAEIWFAGQLVYTSLLDRPTGPALQLHPAP